MLRVSWLPVVLFCIIPSAAAGQSNSKVLVSGLKNPAAVVVGGDGRTYAAVLGEAKHEKQGGLVVVKQGATEPLVTGLDMPTGLAAFQKWLFVAEPKRVLKVDLKGKVVVLAAASAFPAPPQSLSRITVDPESGIAYVCDDGGLPSQRPVIYRIDPKGKVSIVTDRTRWKEIHSPGAFVLDGASHLLVLTNATLSRVNLANGTATPLSTKLGNGAAGMAWDKYGRLFFAVANNGGELYVIPRPGAEKILVAKNLSEPGDICLDPSGAAVLVPSIANGTITAIPAQVPGQPVDFSALPFETAVAFPDLKWTGWQGETDAGKINPLRPIVLTHAGDGSQRNFVATQHGVIHVFPNDPNAKETKVFLNIQDRVRHLDKENEEGFLGLAFHPDYKKTGEFFVFYTPRNQKLVNVVSRFRVSKDDPDKADPASEEIIFTVKRPFWNHDGGTLCFGPDGMLYIALGDGGAANDPFDNAQNLKTHLGSILRIDVNRKDDGKNYATPPDNPFVGNPNALAEIWAYGLRNVWRMAFDRKSGKLWAGEVGQNLYEEINIIEKGGNYGWRRRESLHPFGFNGVDANPKMIEPIWEYHHDIGKSITGGHVYRGRQFPELDGHYLCADYVTGKIWALKYDDAANRVTAWRTIRDRSLPILSFGEDERGEAYLLTYAASGRGIYQLVRSAAAKR